MGQLVSDHVEGAGEALEELTVAIAEHHLLAVPEGVFITLAIMHGADQRHAQIVDGVALEHLPEEGVGRAQSIVGLVHRGVA